MAILSPTSLEEISYGQQGWNSIFNANLQKLNTYFSKFPSLWNPAAGLANNSLLRFNSASRVWEPVTGYTGTVTVGSQTLTFQAGVLISVV